MTLSAKYNVSMGFQIFTIEINTKQEKYRDKSLLECQLIGRHTMAIFTTLYTVSMYMVDSLIITFNMEHFGHITNRD